MATGFKVGLEEIEKPGKVDVTTGEVGETVTVLTPCCVSKYIPYKDF